MELWGLGGGRKRGGAGFSDWVLGFWTSAAEPRSGVAGVVSGAHGTGEDEVDRQTFELQAVGCVRPNGNSLPKTLKAYTSIFGPITYVLCLRLK
jgi:hypothetical protein